MTGTSIYYNNSSNSAVRRSIFHRLILSQFHASSTRRILFFEYSILLSLSNVIGHVIYTQYACEKLRHLQMILLARKQLQEKLPVQLFSHVCHRIMSDMLWSTWKCFQSCTEVTRFAIIKVQSKETWNSELRKLQPEQNQSHSVRVQFRDHRQGVFLVLLWWQGKLAWQMDLHIAKFWRSDKRLEWWWVVAIFKT